MNEFDKLKNFLSSFNLLTDDEMLEFSTAFAAAKIRKRQFIVQPGFIAKTRHFVTQGAFRAFVLSENGTEYTISFAIEDWWITDYNSYIFQQPATMFVVALEDSTILKIDYEAEKQLKASNHKFETIFRIMAERGLAFQQRRLISNLIHSAEERYDHFLEKYPQIVPRMPQYALASYLDMTTEFLSKIRNRKRPKKS